MFVDVDGARINKVAVGDGPETLLAVGGWAGSGELWLHPFERLSGELRCVTYDHRGSGATVAEIGSITPRRLVDDVLAVMDALGIERCALAGESSGGVIAMLAALHAPERFSRLILVDSPTGFEEARTKPLVDGSRHDYPATVAAFVHACTPEPDVEHIRRWGRQILLRAEPEAAARLLECLYEKPLELDPGRIAQSTLILHGADDMIIPVAHGHALDAAIPDSRLVIFEATGHVPTLTRPAQVAEAISEFLAER